MLRMDPFLPGQARLMNRVSNVKSAQYRERSGRRLDGWSGSGRAFESLNTGSTLVGVTTVLSDGLCRGGLPDRVQSLPGWPVQCHTESIAGISRTPRLAIWLICPVAEAARRRV